MNLPPLEHLPPHRRVARLARAVGARLFDLKALLYGFEDCAPSLGVRALVYDEGSGTSSVTAVHAATPPAQRAIHEIYRLRDLINRAFDQRYRPEFAGVARARAMAAWYQSRVCGLSNDDARAHETVTLERRAFGRALDEADAAIVAAMSALDYNIFERSALDPDNEED